MDLIENSKMHYRIQTTHDINNTSRNIDNSIPLDLQLVVLVVVEMSHRQVEEVV
jgi:hypothetical protein